MSVMRLVLLLAFVAISQHSGRVVAQPSAGPVVDTRESAAILLFDASRNGQIDAVRDLIVSGVDVNAVDPDGWTALMHAADAGQAEAVRALLEAGADANLRSHAGIVPLFAAAISNKPATVDILLALRSAGADPNARTEAGLTALVAAVARGHDAVAVRLIELGADPNAAGADGLTPLLTAITRPKASGASAAPLIKRMLALGVDPNAGSVQGPSPLMVAVDQGDIDVVEALLGQGADAKAKTADGGAAFDLALSKKFERIAELLARHALPDLAVTASPLGLMTAVVQKDEAAVREQIRLGADANAADPASGWTALMFAAQGGSLPIVEAILAADARVNYANKDGLTALHVAALAGHQPVVERLLKAGANPSARTTDGITLAAITAAKDQPAPRPSQEVVARSELEETKRSLIETAATCSNAKYSERETPSRWMEHTWWVTTKVSFDDAGRMNSVEDFYKHLMYNHSKKIVVSWSYENITRMHAKLADLKPDIEIRGSRIVIKCSRSTCWSLTKRYKDKDGLPNVTASSRINQLTFCNARTARQIANALSQAIRLSGGR